MSKTVPTRFLLCILIGGLFWGWPTTNLKGQDSGQQQSKADSEHGLWIWEDRNIEPISMTLVLFNPDHTGVVLVIGGGTAIGIRCTYTRRGNAIVITPEQKKASSIDGRIEQGQLLLQLPAGDVKLQRTEDDKHYQLLGNENPRARGHEPARDAMPVNPPGSELTGKYYESEATEAAVGVGGEKVFELGDEASAPQILRDKIAALRAVAQSRFAKLRVPVVQVSPDGRMIIMHGFDGKKAMTHIWNDWQNPEAVRDMELYFRGGGRFISNRYIYMGNTTIFDRETKKEYQVPEFDVLDFDISEAGAWIGKARDKKSLRIGQLGSTTSDREIALDGYGNQVMWINNGKHFVVEIINQESRVYDAQGNIKHAYPGIRLGQRLDQHHLFVTVKRGVFAMAKVMDDGMLEIGNPCFGDGVAPRLLSPSNRYVVCLNTLSPSDSDRFEIWRTPLADDDDAIPPRVPKRPTVWLSWTDGN